jgi:hypothetical protein
MKKLYSLIIMLALLCVSWTAKAQETLTVYEGTTTNNRIPAYIYYFDDFTKSQVVFPSSALNDMVGATINSVTFYTTNSYVPYTSVSTADVYLMEVSFTNINDFQSKSDATIVYSGTLSVVSAGNGGELTITFDTPFTYNGGNLLLGIENTTDAEYKNIYFYGQTVSGASFSGSNGTSLSSVTGSQQNFIPMTTFEYIPAGGISCAKPTALNATVTPGQGTIANLTWNENGTATNWVIEYGTAADFSNATTVTASGTPSALLTGLTPETTYYAHVKADCGTVDGQSTWSNTVSFKPSNAYTITLNEGTSTNEYVPVYGYYVDNYSKSQFIIPASDLVNIQGGEITALTFYASQSSINWGNATFDVRLKVVNNTEFENTTLEDWDGMESVYSGSLSVNNNTMTINFSTPFTYTEGNLMIGINQTANGAYVSSYWYGVSQETYTALGGYLSNYGDNNIYRYKFLPKVTIDYTPGAPSACPKPTNLIASEVSAHSAVLNWTENGTASAWQICINNDEENLINVTSTSYTLTGLTAETTYNVKVRSVCGGEDGESIWTPTKTFTTDVACPAPAGLNAEVIGTTVNLTWNSNGDSDTIMYRTAANEVTSFFDDFENGLNNWTIVRNNEGTAYTDWRQFNPHSFNDPIDAHSGDYVAMSRSWSSTSYNVDNWLITPQVTLDGTLKFWVMDDGTYHEHYDVYVSTTTNDISAFTLLYSPGNASNTWTQVSVDLSSFNGTQGYIALRNTDENQDFLFIDDFGIYSESIPAGDWMTAVSNTHNITLTGLAPTTTYEVKVKSDCGEDGSSLWSDTYQFTTDVACPTPISLTADTVTGNSIDLSWTGNGESYDLKYRIPSDEGAIFFDNFENGLDNWTIYTEGEAPMTNGWFTTDASGIGISAISGNTIAAALSYYYDDYYDYSYNASNWLVTPQLPLQGTLKFWVISAGSSYAEHYSVLLSTTGNAITDFTTTLKEYGAAPGEWTQVSIDLSSYAGQDGYIAIHHADTDAYFIFIDDFGIYGEATPAGEWMNVSSTTNSATITGLAPLTTYEVQVMSNCGEDGTSDWSNSFFFTTTELLCSAPSNLVISDTTTTGATLTWTETGDATAWQISLNNDEENLINVTENSTYTFSSLTPGTDYSVKVRANCGETESPWSEVVTFTTVAEIIPTEITISGDTAACPGQFTTLTASTDVEATYAWSNDATTAEITVTQGTYTVTVTSSTGNQLSTSVTVGEYPTYETHEDVTLCESELPYDWHGANVTGPGSYYMSKFTVHACDSAFFLNLTVNPTYEVTDTKTICDNELPYIWNGVEFTEAGIDTITLQTVNGCDSVVTMVLNVNPVVYGVDGWTICSSELPYTYQGIEFTEAGTKYDTLVAANGCDSIVTITLVVKESFTATDAKTICASELPYEWNGVTFTEAGTQNATLDAVNGCDSVVTMTLTVNPTFNTPLTAAICQGGSYEFFGQALTETGVYTDTLQAENGCDSVITLTLTVNVPTEGTVNATVSVYSLPYVLNGISYDSTGVYTQNLTNVAGCDSTLTLTLTVLNSILTEIDSAVCASALPIIWNDLTFTEAGEQSATFVAANGADSVVTLHLTVYPVYNVTDAKAICQTSLPYTWNGIEFTEAGIDTVTLQTVNGCDSVVVMTLTVKESYEVFDTKSICNSELPYEWNGVTFTSNGSETTTLTAANGCDSVVHMTLTVNPVYTTPLIAGICQGDSYEFFGQMLTEAGFYTDTLPTVNGCDSIFTLNLTVYPTYNNTTVPYTMCDGDTCYFHGKMYTEAGTYYDTLQTAHGCDSIITFVLTVNPTYNTPVSATICQGESYAFFGESLTVAGEYTHTLPTINNCDSVITLTLTVNPTYNVTDAATICASELPYTWNGVTFTEAGTQNATLETVNGCDSVVVMTLTVNPIYNVTDAATICASELPYTWNGVVFTEAGTQNATLQTVNGCDSVVVMTLTVNPIYNVTDAVAVCANQLPYTWNGVVFTEAGTQTATLQTINGCDSVVVMTLTVNQIYNVTDAQTICASQLPYTWNGVVFTEAGTQNATLQTVNGCDSVVVMTLTVNPIYNVTDAATICETELPYTWNGVVFTAAGTQNVTLQTVNGCDSVVAMTLTVNPTYSTLLTEAICQGETYNFFGQALTAAGTYNHTLQASTGCDSIIILNLTVNPTYAVTDAATICESELPYTWNGVEFTAAGTQNVTLTAATGCDSVVTMTLTVNPTYAVTDEASICESELPYTWNGVEFTAAGTQNVTLTAANGCDSVVTMTLTVNLSAVSEFTIETPDSCYEWNDVLYCESGDYTQTLTTVAGCDSVVTLHLTTSVGVINYELDSNVYIAPNPAKSVCRIHGLSTMPKYVEIYDMRGGLVMRTNDTEFDVRTLSTGLYMVKVYTGERVINLKLVKE